MAIPMPVWTRPLVVWTVRIIGVLLLLFVVWRSRGEWR
jgi:hypothetical protein